MPKVDFYLIPATTFQASLHFVCRLIEKAYLQKNQVYVRMNNETESKLLDGLLWTFREDSFVPHALATAPTAAPSPITIGFAEMPALSHAIFLNLAQTIAPHYAQFARVIEIVINAASAKALCREKFRAYKQANCELITHDLVKN